MPKDRESLFYYAKQPKRPGSTTSSRRSSTTIDNNGCTITRGFVVPSRSSSQSSLARSTTSSFDTSTTPLSPSEMPSPGFPKSVASSSKSPSLRTSSTASSLPQSFSDSNQSLRGCRPNLERRHTNGPLANSYGSRVDDDDLAATTGCAQSAASSDVFLAPPVIAIERARAKRLPRPQSLKVVSHIRRIKSEQSNLNCIATRGHQKIRSRSTHDTNKRAAKIAVKIVPREHADDAIASDSEDDHDGRDTALSRRISAQRNRLDYATRRALTDDRNAAVMQRVQQVATPPELYPTISTPIPDASYAGADLTKVCQRLELMSEDNAIASDSESEDDYTCKDDPKMTAALKQAFVHRVHNAAPVQVGTDTTITEAEPQKRAMSDAALNFRVPEPGDSDKLKPHRRNISAGNLTVRLIPPQPTKSSEADGNDIETSLEVKTFERGAALAIRSLRPSSTRPKPKKGVLKKSGSPPSTGVSRAEGSPSKKMQTRVTCGEYLNLKAPQS